MGKKKRAGLLFASSFTLPITLPPNPISGQETQSDTLGSVSGIVVDLLSETPLEGAMVILHGVVNRDLVTNPSGSFVFRDLLPGRYLLTVEFLGYATASDSVTVASADGVFVEVRLPQQAIAVEGLIIFAPARREEIDLQPFRDSGMITRDEIAELEGRVRSLKEILRREVGSRIRIEEGSAAGGKLDICVQSNRRIPSIQEMKHWPGCRPVMLVVDGVNVYAPPADESAFADVEELKLPLGQLLETLSITP